MNPPSFRATVVALAAGQLVCWAALYCAFSSFVLPMQRAFGWSKPQMMGALTLGLAVWGAATYAAGAAIDAGRGRARMTAGAALAGISLFARASAPLATAWLLLALPGYREMLLVLAAVGAAAVVAFALARKPDT